jgi:hypothetical protein
MGELTNAYKILVGKPEAKKLLKYKWEDNIKVDIQELEL